MNLLTIFAVLFYKTTATIMPITGYKIKDDSILLGTFIMFFNALLTHISGYYYMYYSVRSTENAINPIFIIYFTGRNGDSFNKSHYSLHSVCYNQWHYHFLNIMSRKLFYKIMSDTQVGT